MRLGVDGTIWGSQHSGVSAASRRLFLQLARGAPDHALTAFVPASRSESLQKKALGENVRLVEVGDLRGVWRIFWQQLLLPRRLRESDLQILYCPCYTVPLSSPIRTVVTVHDLIAWRRPDLCRPRNVLHFRGLVPASVRHARRITVPTQVVKQDLVDLLGVPAEKVDVLPWGVDLEIRPSPRDAAQDHVRRRFGLEGPFILFVGAMERKKNLPALLSAAERIGARLVLVGPLAYGGGSLVRLLGRSATSVRYLGFVPQSELGSLYSAAQVFAFPSHIEGFGLPVVEAMACGTPVVTSDAPALLEVSGGAAVHVPARSHDDLCEALDWLMRDGSARDDLIARGRARAAEFSWARSVQIFSRLVETALGDSAVHDDENRKSKKI